MCKQFGDESEKSEKNLEHQKVLTRRPIGWIIDDVDRIIASNSLARVLVVVVVDAP